ncbi:AAEL000421-PA [Aedes aegypti]|uniref:AAEL000421-PA n=2 Tax=Aedes aegypti TaxID=7159 RepID=A0A1S4EVV6_AEDAE|nr:protein prenyltransferase alpha subunit repeat-containing protein 1-B [Aedes aegypti]EAT48549.1 AAEL000421-PA [Aedes aegypti]
MTSTEAVDYLDDNNAFCEKIINEIYAVFLKDPELTGFEIIPMPSNTNKSPVIHIEHNLGLESWCVQYIYVYAHRLLLRHKAECLKLSGGGSSSTNLVGSSSGTMLMSSSTTGNNAIIKYLNCAILINPDVATFWNVRRQLFAKNRLDITKEFQFSALVLSKKSKSNEAFAYRRWLYLFQSYDAIDWAFEIGLCEKCADKSTTNYHAWCHRQWVIMKAPQLLKFEIYKTEKFIRKHIHDYSCYNHRQFVLAKMSETSFFDEHDGNDFVELMGYTSSLVDSPVKTVDDLLRWLVPTVDRDNLNELKIRSFLLCLNLAAYDLRFCDELKSTYGESLAFENHRRFMIKFIIDRCRSAANILKHDTNGQFSATCNQPMTKITKLDEQDSAFIRAIASKEKTRSTHQHKVWCKLFLGFDFE